MRANVCLECSEPALDPFARCEQHLREFIERDDKAPDPEVAAIRLAVLDGPRTLRDALRDERAGVEPVPGTAGLLHRGQAAEFFSERGHGKSLALCVILASAAHAGERVLILDRENGEAPVAERFRDILIAHPDWAHVIEDGSLEIRFFPTLDRDWRGEDLAAALAGFTIVALDSSRVRRSARGRPER